MPYRKTPARVRHAEEVRSAIVDAALEVVRTDGVDALTVRRLVKAANSSIGNYYHHFGDKESLFVALVDRLADRVAAEADSASAEATDVRTRLLTMVSVGLSAALREPALPRVLFASNYGERVRGRVRRRFIDRTVDFFTRHPVGVAARVDTRLVAVLWQGAILMLIERMATGELEVPIEEAARVCAEWNVRAVGLLERS